MQNLSRGSLLLLSIIFDTIGYLSFIIPGFGEITDVVWAPLSGYLMLQMYQGNVGKVGGAISFIEEALPIVDVIPTFTIVWIYTFISNSKDKTSTNHS